MKATRHFCWRGARWTIVLEYSGIVWVTAALIYGDNFVGCETFTTTLRGLRDTLNSRILDRFSVYTCTARQIWLPVDNIPWEINLIEDVSAYKIARREYINQSAV